MKRTVRCLLLTIFLLISVPVGSVQAEMSGPAPDFTLKDLYDHDVKLSSYFGRPIFLVFVTTWCPSCNAELPKMKALTKNTRTKG